ncbi:uncharacterized protein LOC126998585 [Eriocheir sinensis]|uniref:uncharacterized protein LOC126998585 n=1 Tax=Eriocheir sinensis TaxID=95602 RepID=UPI0021C8D3CD|nr:uncharacterized protein LOC126998585 [Eriocheir sinensis]
MFPSSPSCLHQVWRDFKCSRGGGSWRAAVEGRRGRWRRWEGERRGGIMLRPALPSLPIRDCTTSLRILIGGGEVCCLRQAWGTKVHRGSHSAASTGENSVLHRLEEVCPKLCTLEPRNRESGTPASETFSSLLPRVGHASPRRSPKVHEYVEASEVGSSVNWNRRQKRSRRSGIRKLTKVTRLIDTAPSDTNVSRSSNLMTD